MPVDKFGHTDSGSTLRVVAGGVTLTQINNSFLRLDGTNAFAGNLNMGGYSIEGLSATYTPSEDNHLTTKKYVDATRVSKPYIDEQDATKVSKTGDIITGNLLLNVGADGFRTLGCKDLRRNKQFQLLLGSMTNKIVGTLNQPITSESTDGFRFKINNETALEMVKSMDGNPPSKINVYKSIFMHGANITGLREPNGAGDAATKQYVDNSRKKCRVGYVPNLEGNNSLTGFVVSASSTVNHEAFRAFNNLLTGDSWFIGRSLTSWIQIKCPEPVIIWRLALKVRMECPGISLTASNDGITFTALFATSGPILSQPAPTFFNISTTTAYQYYRLTIVEDAWLLNGIQVMQLYIYDI